MGAEIDRGGMFSPVRPCAANTANRRGASETHFVFTKARGTCPAREEEDVGLDTPLIHLLHLLFLLYPSYPKSGKPFIRLPSSTVHHHRHPHTRVLQYQSNNHIVGLNGPRCSSNPSAWNAHPTLPDDIPVLWNWYFWLNLVHFNTPNAGIPNDPTVSKHPIAVTYLLSACTNPPPSAIRHLSQVSSFSNPNP